MHIPRYWARASVDAHGHAVDPARERSHGVFTGFGWSDNNTEAAHLMALERARAIAARFAALEGDQHPPREVPNHAYYPTRPIREDVVERDDADGWAITRNAYGALVLNTDRVMIIDVDDPSRSRSPLSSRSPAPRPAGCLGVLIEMVAGGAISPPQEMTAMNHARSSSDATLASIREVIITLEDIAARVYRTAGGYRILITSETHEPTSDLARDTMRAFGADPQYINMCIAQESFRARLTPKPWRCTMQPPRERFPFRDHAERTRFADWLERYKTASRDFAVCELIEALGPDPTLAPAIEQIVTLHDHHTVHPGLPLA